MTITLVELVYSELIRLVQRARVSYPMCFDKMRFIENIVDKHESYIREDLFASGRGKLFGTRGLQLPVPNVLMMGRVVKMTETGGNLGKEHIEVELDINPDLRFFRCHFIGDPIISGRLGLDAVQRLVGFYLGWLDGEGKGRALGIGEVKFTGQVLSAAKKVTCRIHFKRIVSRRLIMSLTGGEVPVDGCLIYTVSDLRVGLFQNTPTF